MDAEPLMRRTLAIDEQSYRPEHPDVARDLNNLALLLHATHRLGEAEPLMRRALTIFLKSTGLTGHEHPHLRTVFGNYAGLLEEMNLPKVQIDERLNTPGPEAGFEEEGYRRLLAQMAAE